MSKYGHRNINWFEAIANKLGGEKAAERFLRNELVISKPISRVEAVWEKFGGEEGIDHFLSDEIIVSKAVHHWQPAPRLQEENGIVYLTPMISDGTTGLEWINCLENKEVKLSYEEKSLLMSSDFKPTNGVSYEVAIIKGGFSNKNYYNSNSIVEKAEYQGRMKKTNAEVAYLIWKNFSEEEIKAAGLGLILVMHEYIKDCKDTPRVLATNGNCLGAFYDYLGGRSWSKFDKISFAFEVNSNKE